MSTAELTPVLDYATPADGRAPCQAVGWGLLSRRAAHVLSVAASLLVVALVIGDARLWATEVGSGCGWGRGAVRGGLYVEAFLLVPAAVGPLFIECSRRLFVASRLALLCATAAWMTLFLWFTAQT